MKMQTAEQITISNIPEISAIYTSPMMRMFSRELQNGRQRTAAPSICFLSFALMIP